MERTNALETVLDVLSAACARVGCRFDGTDLLVGKCLVLALDTIVTKSILLVMSTKLRLDTYRAYFRQAC